MESRRRQLRLLVSCIYLLPFRRQSKSQNETRTWPKTTARKIRKCFQSPPDGRGPCFSHEMITDQVPFRFISVRRNLIGRQATEPPASDRTAGKRPNRRHRVKQPLNPGAFHRWPNPACTLIPPWSFPKHRPVESNHLRCIFYIISIEYFNSISPI